MQAIGSDCGTAHHHTFDDDVEVVPTSQHANPQRRAVQVEAVERRCMRPSNPCRANASPALQSREASAFLAESKKVSAAFEATIKHGNQVDQISRSSSRVTPCNAAYR